MAFNKLSSKLSLSVGRGSPHNDTLLNKEHSETAAALTSADIEWQWTSPVGTVSNVKIRSDKTPLQQMKKPCKSISPVSDHFPRKRKLIKNEVIETKFGSVTHPEPSHYVPIPMCDQTLKTELAANNKYEVGLQCSKEDYCALFDEGEDAMDDCLMQCSQRVEENLSQNLKGIIPLEVTTPRSTRVHSAIPKASVFGINASKPAIKQYNENSFPHLETKIGANTQCSSLSVPTFGQGTNNNPSYGERHRPQGKDNTHITLNRTVHDTPAAACEITTMYDINDSFDDILVTFCEENVELLSQPTNERQVLNKNFPLNVPSLRTGSRTAVMKAPETSATSSLPVPQQAAVKSSSSLLFPVPKYEPLKCNKTLDDDFLQPDLLKLLESVEANSQPRPASPMLHCTPEEIENKRRQAKIKLERKKIALKSGLVRT